MIMYIIWKQDLNLFTRGAVAVPYSKRSLQQLKMANMLIHMREAVRHKNMDQFLTTARLSVQV